MRIIMKKHEYKRATIHFGVCHLISSWIKTNQKLALLSWDYDDLHGHENCFWKAVHDFSMHYISSSLQVSEHSYVAVPSAKGWKNVRRFFSQTLSFISKELLKFIIKLLMMPFYLLNSFLFQQYKSYHIIIYRIDLLQPAAAFHEEEKRYQKKSSELSELRCCTDCYA